MRCPRPSSWVFFFGYPISGGLVWFDCLARVQYAPDMAFRHTPTVPGSASSAQALGVGHNFILLSIRVAGRKIDRPLGGNSRLQWEILQLKNEVSTAVLCVSKLIVVARNRQLAEPNSHRPLRKKRWWGRRLEFDSSRGSPFTPALSDLDERVKRAHHWYGPKVVPGLSSILVS